MTGYIKREDAVRRVAVLIAAEAESDGCEDQPMDNYIEYASEDLADIPSADVAPIRRAEWIKREYWSEGVGMGEDWGHYYECSSCGERIKGYDTHLDKYCRKCGAKMKRAQTDEKLVYYDHEPKTENCSTCKNYALCGTTFGCKKKYDDHCGWYIAWPYTAWCEDWEAKDDE